MKIFSNRICIAFILFLQIVSFSFCEKFASEKLTPELVPNAAYPGGGYTCETINECRLNDLYRGGGPSTYLQCPAFP